LLRIAAVRDFWLVPPNPNPTPDDAHARRLEAEDEGLAAEVLMSRFGMLGARRAAPPPACAAAPWQVRRLRR